MQATTATRTGETGRRTTVWGTVHTVLRGLSVPVGWARGMSWRQ